MAFQVSPGVVTKEIDLSTIVPAVATTLAGYCGYFEWGPVDKIVTVDSVGNLMALFGKPNTENFKHWFTAANFLGYGDNLKIVRAGATSAYNAVNSGASLVRIDSYDDYSAATISALATPPEWVARYPGTKADSLKVVWHDGGYGFTFDYGLSGVAVGGANEGRTAPSAMTGFTLADSTGNTFTILAGSGTTAAAAFHIDLSTNTTASPVTGATFTILEIGNTTTGMTGIFGAIAATGGFGVSASQYNNWKYADQFATKMPFTSQFAIDKTASETVYDGVNIAVIDEDGLFSGVKGTVLEVFDGMSKAGNHRTSQGFNNFYKDYINENSNYIYWGYHPTTSSTTNAGVTSTRIPLAGVHLDWGTNLGITGCTFTVLNASGSTIGYAVSMTGGTGEMGGTRTTSGTTQGYGAFADTETVNVNIILGGPAGYTESVGLIDLVEARKDAVVFISPDEGLCINTTSGIPKEASTQTANIVNYREGTLKRSNSGQGINSSYAFLDSGWKYMYDQFNDVFRWVPFNGDVAGLAVRSDEATDPWFSPAGFNRGKLRGVIKLSLNPSKSQRDDLYQANVNPIVAFPGEGTILFGDKTLQSKPSAFDRINVRRLFIVLEKAISTAAKYQLFEQNDAFTRAQFKNMIEPFLRDVMARRGLTDFKVVCDETNNPGSVVDRNEFVADIFVKPTRSINFITLNFIATRSGVSFDEIGV